MDKKKPLALIIEDDEDLSVIFTEVFNEAGFQTETLRNGQLALDRLCQITPEVISLDMLLPGVSGMNVLKYIRSEDRLELTSVIMTTADHEIAEHAHDLADFVLLKPIGFVQLHKLATQLYSALME
jgi:DNA-binding response OmpR family regulator